VATLNEASIPLICWTVNRSEDMDDMIRVGVNGILTDSPQLLTKKLESCRSHR
jgi:glycerophosphoryl diester phosphodiesterase